MPESPKIILEKILGTLGFAASVEERKLGDDLMLDVKTDESGRLIGRQGQTLADLQYLVNRILFQQDKSAPKVLVDVGGYRAEARATLVNKAMESAEKVRRWGEPVELEPMSAYDRRTVHQALKDDPDIETQSIEVDGTEKKVLLLRPKRR